MNPNEQVKKEKKDYLKELNAYLTKVFNDPIKVFKILLTITIVVAVLILGLLGYSFFKNKQLNTQTENLKNFTPEKISSWGIDDKNFSTSCEFSSVEKMTECLNKQIQEKVDLTQAFDKLQVPYSYFLINLYLPSMNIWYDQYTDHYDTSIIGDKFLSKNPFLDVKLMKKWSDFFKKVSDNLPTNDIENIKVGNVEPVTDGGLKGYNKVKIQVEFSASQNNSFIMLVDKLSSSSNKRNISLISEFTYDLWDAIKSDKTRSQVLDKLTRNRLATIQAYNGNTKVDKTKLTITDDDINKTLGQQFYQWVTDSCDDVIDPTAKSKCQADIKAADYNKVFVDSVISKALKKAANCDNPNDTTISSECYYNFREKFKSVPALAYTVGENSSASDKSASLKKFYSEIPPLLNITKFSFDKQQDESSDQALSYKGKIEFEIYGRAVKADDLKAIQSILGKQCFNSDTQITADLAIQTLSNKVNKLSQSNGDGGSFQTEKFRDYSELNTLLTKLQSEFSAGTDYDRVVRTFEIYRMLNENNLCQTDQDNTKTTDKK